MNGAGKTRPLDMGNPAPVAISARQKCAECGRIKSQGQFEINGNICVRCKPQPAGWRRGDFK